MARSGSDDDAAALWAVRLDAGPLDDADRDALNQWLATSPGREGDLLRAQAALAYLDRGRALRTAGERMADRRTSLLPRRAVIAGGLGAAAAAAAAGYVWLPARPQVVATGIGELRRIPLADGSVATLNTKTKLEVMFAKEQRTVLLADGEAWFDVAHDRQRPFVVETGNVRVRAVGTAFSVRRRVGGAEVLVTDGTIETWVVGHEAERRRVTVGDRGFVPERQGTITVESEPAAIERALAWRGGELALDGDTLAHAVQEINRYNVRQLTLGDPEFGREPLVGYFRTIDPEKFARSAAAIVGGHVEIDGDNILIVKAN